jgi:hypothetical protein
MKYAKGETWKLEGDVYRAYAIGKRLKTKIEKLIGAPAGEYYKSIKHINNPFAWSFQFSKKYLTKVNKLIKNA